MRDALGRELEVGQRVASFSYNGGYCREGVVDSFTEQRVRVLYRPDNKPIASHPGYVVIIEVCG